MAPITCTPPINGFFEALLLYVHVAFGAFMSYLFTPSLTKDQRARVIFERLVSAEGKERAIETVLLVGIVFGGGYVAFVFGEPCTLKQAITFGLGWTSLASAARTSVGYAAGRTRQSSAPQGGINR